jgi:CRISPR-associated protein Csx10
MRIFYSLTTVDPVIISHSITADNAHEVTDFIPGNTILGMLASKLYSSMTANESWLAFHSGLCRFSHCYPVVNNEICLPIPASWHFEKNVSFHADQKLILQKLTDFSNLSAVRKPATQYKQCKGLFINSHGELAAVQKDITTRTAIDRKTGSAHKGENDEGGRLFTYAMISAGQQFGGWIDVDDTAIAEQIKQALTGEHRIGRSRNTEFGRVKVILSENDLNVPANKSVKKHLVVWCVTDCELLDQQGLPCFTPTADSIHAELAGAKLLPENSFIIKSRINFYNQKRQGYDTEHHVIQQGSVLVYELATELNESTIASIQQQGIGINKQQGFGQVILNPQWSNKGFSTEHEQPLSLFTPLALKTKSRAIDTSSALPSGDSRLLQWINQKSSKHQSAAQSEQKVSKILVEIVKGYQNARQFNHIVDDYVIGPSASQWRRIFELIRYGEIDWQQKLFNDTTGICKVKGDNLGWGCQWLVDNHLITFADYLKQLVSDLSNDDMCLLLEKLCRYDFSTLSGLNKFNQVHKKTAPTEIN